MSTPGAGEEVNNQGRGAKEGQGGAKKRAAAYAAAARMLPDCARRAEHFMKNMIMLRAKVRDSDVGSGFRRVAVVTFKRREV